MMRALIPSIVCSALLCPAIAFALLQVTATPTAGVNNLTMDGRGSAVVRIIKIADIEVISLSGATLVVSSGSLTKTGENAVAFQVALVADNAAAPASTAFTVASGSSLFQGTDAGTIHLDLYIKYKSADLQDPGTYAATVNLSVFEL